MKSVLDEDPDNHAIVIYSEEPDMGRIEAMGVDFDRLHVLGCYEDEETKLQTAEKHLELVKRAVQDESVKLVVIDSLKALCSTKQLYTKKGDIKDLEDDEQIAIRAKMIGEFVRDFVHHNKKAILFMTNQVSDQIGISYEIGPEFRTKTPGGRYKEYMAQLRIEASTRPIYSEKEHPLTGKRLLLGWEACYRLVKNKFSKSSGNRVAVSEFMFDPPGFRRESEILNCADYLGLIQKGGGGFYTIKDNKIRGIDAAIKFLKTNPKISKELELEILNRSEELFMDKGGGDIDLLA